MPALHWVLQLSTARLASLRPVLASVLLAVLAVGGVVLPSVHRAAHAMEQQAESDAHQDAYHGGDAAHLAPEADGAPLATAPCPPLPHDVDCAICSAVSLATAVASASTLSPETEREAFTAHADWIRTQAASGAGARAPPIG